LSTTVTDSERVCMTGPGPVDDAQAQQRERVAVAVGLHAQQQLGVDLGEVREVALGAVGRSASTSPVSPPP
jgi:hypothetical protein